VVSVLVPNTDDAGDVARQSETIDTTGTFTATVTGPRESNPAKVRSTANHGPLQKRSHNNYSALVVSSRAPM
jgi:hypothetical protein